MSAPCDSSVHKLEDWRKMLAHISLLVHCKRGQLTSKNLEDRGAGTQVSSTIRSPGNTGLGDSPRDADSKGNVPAIWLQMPQASNSSLHMDCLADEIH